MAAVPVIINGMLYPKEKGAQGVGAMPAVFCGLLSIAGLSIGGGPIIPPDPPVIDPPPVDPPIDPPEQPPAGPQVAVVLKPAPETGGWGLATDSSQALQWFYVPSEGGPKN